MGGLEDGEAGGETLDVGAAFRLGQHDAVGRAGHHHVEVALVQRGV
jgi:hypothetical protein